MGHDSEVAVVTFDDGFIGGVKAVLLVEGFGLDDGQI